MKPAFMTGIPPQATTATKFLPINTVSNTSVDAPEKKRLKMDMTPVKSTHLKVVSKLVKFMREFHSH